jgi:hypothetical protein
MMNQNMMKEQAGCGGVPGDLRLQSIVTGKSQSEEGAEGQLVNLGAWSRKMRFLCCTSNSGSASTGIFVPHSFPCWNESRRNGIAIPSRALKKGFIRIFCG